MSVFVLQNLSKNFTVNKIKNQVLNNINIDFPNSGLISIVGKSGCGKSTLLNILMGIEKPSSGKVLFCGEDISKFSDNKFSQYHLSGVSLIFQHYNLFNDFSAIDNVALPLQMLGENRKEALEKANELFIKFGIQNLSERKVDKLSGGEKQRVAILRSLITDPLVLLCDEPTGALDSQNSEEIMEILREISKNKLVIMVSHNKQLVEKYSDNIIEIKNGNIVAKSEAKNIKKECRKIHLKKSYSSKWVKQFFKHNLKTNLKKNIFSVFACLISFTAMFISVGFSEGSKKSQEDALNKNLSLGFAKASESTFIKIEGSPLSYEKVVRPKVDLVDKYFKDFKSIHYEENLSYFLSSYPTCIYQDNKITSFELLPLYDMTLSSYGKDMLRDGSPANGEFENIFINEEFEKLLDKNCLNNELILSNTANVNYVTGDTENPFVKDSLSFQKKFKICGIIKEFSFLNTPKIYFSYNGAKDYLKSQVMENTSKFLNKKLSFYDYLISCNNDDPVCSYSCYLFITDSNEISLFNKKISDLKDEPLQVSSKALETQTTYKTFIDSFSGTLIIFTIIAFVGINFILGMISLSTFLENRKKTAILTCLGAKNKSIYKLYLLENYLVVFLSLFLGVILSIFLETKLNPFLYDKFLLNNLIQIPFKMYANIPGGIIIFMLLIALIFITLFTLVPMIIYRHNSITDELRDE